MLGRCKARITKISKDDMVTCSSRVIWADLTNETNGEKYHVAWADTPSIFGITGIWSSRNKEAFSRAWTCKEGDEVWLYHAEDSSYNFFEPL